MWLGVDLRMGIITMFKRYRSRYSKYVTCSTCDGRHNWGDLYDHLKRKKISTFDHESDIHMRLELYEENVSLVQPSFGCANLLALSLV